MKTLLQPRYNPKNEIKPLTQIQNLIFLPHYHRVYKTSKSKAYWEKTIKYK